MQLNVKCKDCRLPNAVPHKSGTRTDYAKQYGETFELRCNHCGHIDQYEVDDIYATADSFKKWGIKALIVFVAVAVLSVIFPYIWVYAVFIGFFTMGLFYHLDSRKILDFNRHKFKGRIHFMSKK